MNAHEQYMQRCLELARQGFGKVAPNPMVGCVIVHGTEIIGEGFHQRYGGSHAEVNAINAVVDKSLLKTSTLYVNLEPCSHFGKTPPCADLIISNSIHYVVIGSIDPNPLVKGKGMHRLASSGCDVKVGVLENECKELNKRFYTFYEKKRPYIILKWVSTADGYIGIKSGRLKITEDETDKLVHRWRSEEQGIVVGTNTALTDNPQLTVRSIEGKNPLRVLIDRKLKIPEHFHLFDKSTPTVVFTGEEKEPVLNLEYVTVDFTKDVLKQLMDGLYKRHVQSVLIEGGAELLNSFIKQNYWDEARVITSKKQLSDLSNVRSGIARPNIEGRRISDEESANDQITYFKNVS